MFGLVPFNRNPLAKNSNDGIVDFYNIIDDFFGYSIAPFKRLSNESFKIDVKENENEYNIIAELPGIKKEEISIDYENGRLSISVNRKEEVNKEENNYIHRERKVSSMARGLYLKDIDINKV